VAASKGPTEVVPSRRGLSARDTAYEVLRDRIISLDIAPGVPLDESVLSRELGLGLTPIRDAIKRLALEHLAVVHPRRGTFATEVNLGDERWLSEARLALEGLAAELAASRATTADREELMRHADALGREHTATGVNEHDASFHRALYRAAHNPFIEVTLNQYLNLSLRLWYYCQAGTGRTHEPDKLPVAVVAAILEMDGKRARAHIEEHLRRSSADLRAVM